MRYKTTIKSFAVGVIAFGLGAPTTVFAQDSLNALRDDQMGVSASIGFIVPFGQMGPQKDREKARLGIGFTVDRYDGVRRTGLRDLSRFNMVDLGFFEDRSPSFQLYGQELYRPLFDPLYAEQTDDGEPVPTGLEKPIDRREGPGAMPFILATGVAALAIGVLVNEGTDEFNDCVRSLFDSDEC